VSSSQAGKHPKLEKMGSNLMKTVPVGVRAFLFGQMADSHPLQELWRSGSIDKGTGGDGKRVLGICSKRHRSVLIHDAEKDTQMRGIKFRSFQSALCVPVFDNHKSFIGAILLLSDQTDTFTNEHKFAVERSARDYGPTLTALGKVTEEAKSEEPTEAATLLLSPVALLSMVLAFVFLGIWSMAPPIKDDTPAPVQTSLPQSVSHQALDTADQFLASLQQEKYDQAWLLLGPELKSRWAPEDFKRELSSWVGLGDNKEILNARHISKVQRHNRSAQVLIFESTVAGDRERWNWELREENGDWGLTKMEGPIPGR
jgi:hypothetical protein